MKKNYHFYIDDVIWVFRDLARQKPKTLFENDYLKVLKNAHDRYDLRVQLNVFYRTDFFYGDDEFTLAMMPDIYIEEWEANSNWLKLAFHAKQEFPDYPYINATYDTLKNNYEAVKKEIIRFAGEKTFTSVVNPHWLPVSYQACKAYYDCGVRILGSSTGKILDTDSYIDKLPYGHKGRMLQNRQPETGLTFRETADTAINISLRGYNHINEEIGTKIHNINDFYFDEKTGLKLKRFCTKLCLNLYKLEEIPKILEECLGKEYIGCGNHEQYFYKDYYAYQPDYGEKIYEMAKILKQNGYKPIYLDEI